MTGQEGHITLVIPLFTVLLKEFPFGSNAVFPVQGGDYLWQEVPALHYKFMLSE